ncbi:MAG: glycine zipper domain-containing protein [Methanosarcinales archaeon]
MNINLLKKRTKEENDRTVVALVSGALMGGTLGSIYIGSIYGAIIGGMVGAIIGELVNEHSIIKLIKTK